MNTTLPSKLDKDQILMLAGDISQELYIVVKGKILIFVQKGSQIIPLTYVGPGEFIGELSFFDQSERSASAIALVDSDILKINSNELHQTLPLWMKTLGSKITKKIRDKDDIIKKTGMRKKSTETIGALEISEQARIYKLVESYKASLKTK